MKKNLIKYFGFIAIALFTTFAIVIPMPIFAGVVESVEYPLVAYFEGIEDGVELEEGSYFTLPEEFTSGNVIIKAKACVGEDDSISPDLGNPVCANKREITLRPLGIANGEQINNTVSAFAGGITVREGFNDYGKANVHIASNPGDLENNDSINKIINFVSSDLIEIKAETPLPMSFSFGTVATNTDLLTNRNSGNVSVFFGNNEANIIARGPNVDKITRAVGGTRIFLMIDGSITVGLPSLSKETTTTVEVTILMKDGTSVEKEININRTSILLQHSNADGDNSVYAGYVFNKAYLYNNQNHSDEVFDAYLQMTLYKDDTVVGFKQIKIDDEEYINDIIEDESGSIELYSDEQIPLYGRATDDLIEGVNKVSVFLTNGPIEFDTELPSIEFGIGSGVTLEWEEN